MIFLYIVFLSIGEALWSPRLYGYSAAIAPKGQEASYMSLSYLPFFVAKFFVGTLSGLLLTALLSRDRGSQLPDALAHHRTNDPDHPHRPSRVSPIYPGAGEWPRLTVAVSTMTSPLPGCRAESALASRAYPNSRGLMRIRVHVTHVGEIGARITSWDYVAPAPSANPLAVLAARR